MKDLFKFPLNIQMFGEETPAGGDEGNDSAKTGEEFEDDKKTYSKSELDKEITKALQTQANKSKEATNAAIQKAVEDAIAEEQRKAQLTEEQRQEEARIAAQKALEAKEAELNTKLLKVDVGQVLVEKGLNPKLIDFVLGENLEDSTNKINSIEKIIDEKVESNIKAIATRPGAPKNPGSTSLTKEDIQNIKDPVARRKAISDNMELFK